MNDMTAKDALLEAVLMHVPFDGWSKTSFEAAILDCGMTAADAAVLCPRGIVDLVMAFHHRGDALMLARFAATDLSDLRYSEKIAALVRMRLEVVEDKEIVRKASALFALPQHAGDGAKLIWGTCDAIWNALGDSSDDVNWYTKRATLSAVYGSCVLFWLGDESEGEADTWAFLDRRIENVMQIEKIKASAKKLPFMNSLLSGLSHIRAPKAAGRDDLPGYWAPTQEDTK